MAETALNFGPDWIRALATGSASATAPTSMPIPRYSLAEFRYGREEMLALIPKDIKLPNCLQQYQHLIRDNFQIPLALTPVTEDEQRLWTRCVNSDVALRASGKTGPGYGMSRIGRGGSVDRGRGRGRGGYYQRSLMHDDSEDGALGFSRPKVERSLSANEKDHRWDDRDRRYDRTFSGRGGLDDNNLKHDNMRGPNDYWRKFDKEDDGDWRSSGYRSSDKMGGRGSWRNNTDRDRRDMTDRNPQNRTSNGNSRSSSGPQAKPGNHPWKDDSQGNLPEWSVEESTEPDTVGTFDSSGAFLETKVTGNKSLDEIYVSDDADEGTNKGSPEAKKESSKKTPKKSQSAENSKKLTNKQNSKTSNENLSTDNKASKQSISEPSKSNSKNSPKSSMGKPMENVIQLSTVTEEQRAVKKEPDLRSVSQPNVPMDVAKTKVKGVLLTNVRNSENTMTTSGTAEEDTFAHHQKATENMVAQWTEEIEEQRVTSHADNIHPTHHEKNTKWFYQDPQGEIQGPFTSAEMLEWFSAGYFTMGLMVRRSCDEKFSQLGDLIKAWDRVPFMPDSSPPPIRVTPLTSSLASPITQTIVPNPVTASTSAQLPKQDDQLLALQQQLYQQQIMQQQLMLRQAQMQQILAQLKQQDNFTSLNSQQQEQVLMQQFIAQQQIIRANLKSIPENAGLLDSLGLSSLPPVVKNDMSMWQTPPAAGTWPINSSETQPPGGSIWDVDLSKPGSEESPVEKQKLAEEHEKIRRAEELRLEQEREMEEKRKKEELRRKQEEMRMQQELQKKDEERKRLEEMQRQREEEQHQEELKRLEEQRREEDERKKQAEFKRLEEIRKQEELMKQEELRKQEEKKQLEELKRKEELRRLEELKKQQELRKEEKRKKEEQKKLLLEKEREKQLELERQKEALRLKELEREERLLREKKEREELELKRLAELKLKSQGPVWGIQKTQANESEMSLVDIQRIQEEKEREDREEKMRKQQMMQQAEKQVQQSKNGISWAKRTNDSQPVVKSLIEIQQEEAEQLAHRMQKPPAPAPTVNINAGAWGNSSHLNKITAAPSWNNTNSVSASGFWEDVPSHNTQARKPSQKTNSDTSAFPALANHPVQPAAVSSNKSKNLRAKKDEDAVARLFGSHHKPTDEFTKWCTDAISAMPSSVDVPTFVAFLKDIESPYEVYDYVKSYFGEGKEPREFAKLFLEKRSKFRNQAKQAPAEDNSLWGPAPAITPVVNKTSTPSSTDCDGNSSTRGKTKKRKNRMQKLDSSMLGFTVQSNPDRLNVGEIDHIENV